MKTLAHPVVAVLLASLLSEAWLTRDGYVVLMYEHEYISYDDEQPV
jgi:hypothetical protein